MEKINPCMFTGFTCFGCCQVKPTNLKEVEAGLDGNTFEYDELKKQFAKKKPINSIHDQVEFHTEFRDRYEKDELDKSGICLNLIKKNDCIFCPLHEKQNEGYDIRVGYCNTGFLCPTAKLMVEWDSKTLDLFKFFVNDQFEKDELDLLSFSVQMRNDSLRRKFEQWRFRENL